MTALHELIKRLQVTPVKDKHFLGAPSSSDSHVYGGLILTQAIDAARQCCPADFAVQSLHGQFLRPGIAQQSIEIRVEALKKGRRFMVYNVYCEQQAKIIFFATITFYIPEDSFEHTLQAPELILPDKDKAQFYIDRSTALPDDKASSTAALEVRIEDINRFDEEQAPEQITWFKAHNSETAALTDWQQTLLLAYCSDWNMPIVAARPHTLNDQQKPKIASLDHSIWFYRQPQLQQWTAFVKDSPAAHGGRGHTRGLIYSQQGELLACVNQESFLMAEAKD
jgi:acyl-CoA thioesterase-2